MHLAIIMPALNEEGCIGDTLRRIPGGLAAQVIVVDNGSTDRTAAVACAAGATVITEPRRGYGQACLAGIAELRPDIDRVAILDADGSDDSAELSAMCARIEEAPADLVLSARVLGEATRHLSPQQRFGNWLACWLIARGWGHRYRDMGPLRVLRREALERLQMSDPTWGWNVEMQIKAIEHGLRIIEVPVSYGQRQAGQSKISGSLVGTVRAGTKILTTIGRYWWRSRRRGVPAAMPEPRRGGDAAPPGDQHS